MVFADAARHTWKAVLALCLAIVLTACSAVIGTRAGEDDWALRGEDAFRWGRYAEAEQHWRSGLHAAERQRRNADAAGFRLNLARLYEARGDYAQALRVAAEVADYAQRVGQEALQARALNVVALVQRRLGRNAESLATAKEAHRIARKIDSPALQAESLMHLGAAHQAREELDQAYDAYTKGLALAQAAGDRQTEAGLHNDLGGLYRFQAEYQQANDAYQRALTLRRQLGDVRGEGKVLGNLCILYQNLNDLHRALHVCKDSLTLARAIGDRALEAKNRNNIGGLHRTLGEYPQALDTYSLSLRMKRKLGDRAGEARALGNLGDVHRRQGNIATAIEYLGQSMRIAEDIGDDTGQSASQYLLGLSYLDSQRYADACTAFGKALALQTTIGRQPELTWRGFAGLSRCWEGRSNPALAIFFGKHAVNEIQRVRSNIHELDPELQRAFLRDKAGAYRRLIDLLVDYGRLAEAEQVLAMLKEEEYFDFIRRDKDAVSGQNQLNYGPDVQDWEKRYQAISNQLVALGEEMQTLEQIEPTARSAAEQERVAALDADLEVGRLEFSKLLDEMGPAFAKLDARRLAPRQLDIDRTVTVKDLNAKEPGTVLLQYVLLEKTLLVLLTTGQVQKAFKLPTGEKEINRMVVSWRQALKNSSADAHPMAELLYTKLIEPLASDLDQAKARTLMLSLDGVLRYVPFGALEHEKKYLAESYASAIFVEAAAAQIKDTRKPEWRVAGLGLTESKPGFPPLPGVRAELEGIVREKNETTGLLPGIIRLDADFTADSLRSSLATSYYPVLHLASHFQFQPGNEDESFLLLGDGGHLTLAQLRKGTYKLAGVDLLALSACDTAKGGGNNSQKIGAQGQEVEGMAVTAQNRGAKSVLATLWAVADASTALLMREFYRQTQVPGLTKAEALRQAQVRLMRGVIKPTAEQGERGARLESDTPESGTDIAGNGKSYSHPFYWAPFILMGNWL